MFGIGQWVEPEAILKSMVEESLDCRELVEIGILETSPLRTQKQVRSIMGKAKIALENTWIPTNGLLVELWL